MPQPTHLLFTDLETTGLDPRLDDIIEAGFILTTTELTVVEVRQNLVRPTPAAMTRLLGSDALVRMHTANGLLAELGVTDRPTDAFPDTVLPVADVERQVIGLLAGHGTGKGLVHLAGSGVAAFDKPFLARHMPLLCAHLHYAPIDVGVLRRTWQMWTGADLVTVNQDKTHRALDDARCHLAEATAFRRVFAAAAARGMPIPG